MSIVTTIALAIYGAMLIGIVCVKGIGKMRKDVGVFFCVIVAAFLHSMATKIAPIVAYDTYISNAGTHYTNNLATIAFRWQKNVVTMPDSTPLVIARSPLFPTNWTEIVTTTVGLKAYDLAISSTNFMYCLYCDYTPPTPVHTNGVWVGEVIEKAKNEKGVGKLLIINGKLLNIGKVIAP